MARKREASHPFAPKRLSPDHGERFREIHKAGAGRHTAAWLRANIAAVNVARMYDVELDLKMKAFISNIVLNVLDVVLLEPSDAQEIANGRTAQNR